MIERKFTAQKFKEFRVTKHVRGELSRVGLSGVKLQRTSLGEKILIRASRPGLVVGRGGQTIQKLTTDLKGEFSLENPQIEIEEVKDIGADAAVVAETITNQLERFGTQRFKGIGHKMMETVMRSGSLGVEILISGKIPSSRAKTWRFADGYMKKCGDLAITGVDTAKHFAQLKTGIVGVQVRIMPGTTKLPDQVTFTDPDAPAPVTQEVSSPELEKEVADADKKAKKESKEDTPAKKAAKKKTTKKAKETAEEVSTESKEGEEQ